MKSIRGARQAKAASELTRAYEHVEVATDLLLERVGIPPLAAEALLGSSTSDLVSHCLSARKALQVVAKALERRAPGSQGGTTIAITWRNPHHQLLETGHELP